MSLDELAKKCGTAKSVVVPPEGFRLLVAGERIREGDVYCRGIGHSWHKSRSYGGKWSASGHWPMARRKNARNQGQTPQGENHE
jgi:hypothetical protein